MRIEDATAEIRALWPSVQRLTERQKVLAFCHLLGALEGMLSREPSFTNEEIVAAVEKAIRVNTL